jgi:hypothetical protein
MTTILWVILLCASLLSAASFIATIIGETRARKRSEKQSVEMGRKMWYDTMGEDIFNDKNYKRKDFMKNMFFGICAAFAPKILMGFKPKEHTSKVVVKLNKGSFTVKNRNECETSMAMTEKEIADLKLRHCILRQMPPGKYIDLRILRKSYCKK